MIRARNIWSDPSEPQVTIDDMIFEGYIKLIKGVIFWAFAEANRPKPVQASIDFLDDFIPGWRESYCSRERSRSANDNN